MILEPQATAPKAQPHLVPLGTQGSEATETLWSEATAPKAQPHVWAR